VVTINMCARGWLKPWVAAILKFLCQNQRREDALALYELLGSTVGETQREAFLPRLEMLLFAEQFGKAKELAMSALDASPNELSVLAPATEALMVSGEYAIVEPHLKRYYQLARDFFQSDHFKLAVDRLALLYERLGRKEDSERLDRIFGAYGVLAHAERLLLQDPKGPIQPGGIPAVPSADPAPKQGKNRPCLCGSGKKYKLCCKPREEHQTGARLSRAT
jgi:tetratricopeptide (TPR) repeat protein